MSIYRILYFILILWYKSLLLIIDRKFTFRERILSYSIHMNKSIMICGLPVEHVFILWILMDSILWTPIYHFDYISENTLLILIRQCSIFPNSLSVRIIMNEKRTLNLDLKFWRIPMSTQIKNGKYLLINQILIKNSIKKNFSKSFATRLLYTIFKLANCTY